VAAVGLVIGLAGYAGNAELGRRELDALLSRVSAGQGEVAYSNNRIAAAVAYTTPLLFRASLQPQVRASLRQIVTDAAAGQVDAMREEQGRVTATQVLPWHRDRVRARAALASYLQARVSYLRAVAADLQALYDRHPELDRLFAQARTAFLAAATTASGRARAASAFAGGTHPALTSAAAAVSP
jgi:hypothetical protein